MPPSSALCGDWLTILQAEFAFDSPKCDGHEDTAGGAGKVIGKTTSDDPRRDRIGVTNHHSGITGLG